MGTVFVMSKYRKYSAEFKREAAELSHQSNVSVSQVIKEIGIRSNLRRELAFESASALDKELASFKRELSRVKKERCF